MYSFRAKIVKICGFLFAFFFLTSWGFAHVPLYPELVYLKDAYPAHIKQVSPAEIIWQDNSKTRIRYANVFFESLATLFHRSSYAVSSISIRDLQCDAYEPFFKKMYGSTKQEVREKLVTIYWMPQVFGKRYPLKVTTVNDVHLKLQRISARLEKLPLPYYKYLADPGGTFYWRNVKGEKYLSAHSFGIAIDINSKHGNYWLWDLQQQSNRSNQITYRNKIPMEIVKIFEDEGFLWGGRWYFYDTMHFEYRPELFTHIAGLGSRYHNKMGLRCTR